MGGYGISLIAALVVVSGVIAYVGDVLGRRMGRRRLTLFNLRPRHTAVAISVFAGMLIAAFTLTSAMLVSQNVRDAFLHVEAMRKQNALLERTRRQLEAQVESSRARAALAQQRLEQTQERLQEVSTSLQAQTRDLAGARGQLRQVSSELRRKAAELEEQKRNLLATSGRLEEVAAELAARRRELVAQHRELEDARAKLAATQQQLEKESARLSQVERDLEDRNQQLANAERVMANTARTLIRLQTQRDELQAQIQDLSEWNSRAWRQFQVMSTQPVMFGANEEMLTVVIEGGRPPDAVRKDLEQLVTLLNEIAVNAGAGTGSGERAIAIFRPVQNPASGQPIYYGEEQVLDALAQAIGATQGGVVVRAASVRNVVRGETVLVDFELFHNELVFHQGEELAETSVDSSQDQASLLLDLVAFLRNKVSARAREAGVMARPAGRLPSSGETLFPGPDAVVGEIRYPELLKVISDIQNHNGRVRVAARAAADTWTAGPLQVKLDVDGRT